MIPYTLRIDEELKRKLEEIADKEKRSLNMTINKILEDYVKNQEQKKTNIVLFFVLRHFLDAFALLNTFPLC